MQWCWPALCPAVRAPYNVGDNDNAYSTQSSWWIFGLSGTAVETPELDLQRYTCQGQLNICSYYVFIAMQEACLCVYVCQRVDTYLNREAKLLLFSIVTVYISEFKFFRYNLINLSPWKQDSVLRPSCWIH